MADVATRIPGACLEAFQTRYHGIEVARDFAPELRQVDRGVWQFRPWFRVLMDSRQKRAGQSRAGRASVQG